MQEICTPSYDLIVTFFRPTDSTPRRQASIYFKPDKQYNKKIEVECV